MTNKEQLATLSSQEWVQRVDWLYHGYGRNYTHTNLAVRDWLDQEYQPVYPEVSNTIPSYEYCPICNQAFIPFEPKCPRCLTELNWSRFYRDEHEPKEKQKDE